MLHNRLLEVSVLVVLIVLSVVILNPLHLWMPSMMHMTVLGALLALFAALAAFVLREHAGDEREVHIRMFSGRIGYLAGAFVLVLAIALQSLHGEADPWLVYALLAMLAGKLLAHLYADTR